MITSLNVKNLALIESAEVEFRDGLNVFTGETGAGKSLVIGSVNLALGGRVRSDIQRDENIPTEIELVFSLEEQDKYEIFKELDIPVEDDGLVIIRRKIDKGKSSAKINGRTVTGAQLKEVSSLLIDVHAQSDHQSLLYEKNHLLLLDRYGGEEIEGVKAEYGKKYLRYRKLKDEYENTDCDQSVLKREEDILKYETEEIKNAGLKEGEDAELEDSFRLMNESKKISLALNEVYNAVSAENEGASALLTRALRSFSAVSECDRNAENLYNELVSVDSLLGDFLRDLKGYSDTLEYSAEDFDRVTKRLDRINELKLKYGRTLEEINAALKEREDRLSILANYEEHVNNLKAEMDEAYREMSEEGAVLTSLRKKYAAVLSEAMVSGLKDLNFADSRFEVKVESDTSFGPTGGDRVYFNISTNPGEELMPLKDVASGGELSRIMLALKTVLADTDEIGTMIFDEIDSGISGRTAQKVSESLLKLSGSHQVILITHLPQIASMADNHYLIEKDVENGRTRTGIRDLSREEMITELARMLSGATVTETVLNNAREMKDLADREKERISGR